MTLTPTPPHRFRRLCLVGSGLFAACLLALLTAPWWGRLPLAHLLRERLSAMDMEDVHLSISHLGLTSLQVENLHLTWQGHALSIAHIELAYDPLSLLSRRLESAIITGLNADIQLDALLAPSPHEPTDSTPAESSLRETLPSAIPLDRLLLADSQLRVHLGQHSLSWDLQANFRGGKDCQLNLIGEGPTSAFTLGADLQLATADGDVTLTFEFSELSPALLPYASLMPEDFQAVNFSSGPLQLDAALAIENARPAHWALILANTEGTLELPPYDFGYLNLALGASGRGSVPEHLWLTLDFAQATYEQSGMSWSKFTAELRGGERLDITLQQPAFYRDTLRAALPEGTVSLAAIGAFDFQNFTPGHRIKLAIPAQAFTASQGDTSLAGEFSAKSTLRWDNGLPDGTVNFNLLQANMQAPAYQAELTDLSGNIALSSLLPPATDIAQQLHFASLSVGQYTFEDSNILFELQPGSEQSPQADVRFNTHFLGGKIKTRILAPLDNPQDVRAVLVLEHVDAEQLAQLIPDFQGIISGKISGQLNASLHAGQVLIQQGQLSMDGGSPGALSIARGSWQLSGMSAEQVDELVAGKRIDEIFQLPGGETLVTELALRDLRLDAFQLQVHPRAGDTPRVEIHVEGSSQVAGATVPIVLDIPIRIDLEAAIQDWLRYSEMTGG